MLFDTDSGGGKYEIQKSLRFRASASAYLSRTPSVTGNRKTWTWSGWVKRGVLGVQKGIFECVQSAAPNVTSIIFNSDNTIGFQHYVNGGVSVLYTTGAVCRDPSAWYHLTFVLDTTISTAANRFKVYINGVQVSTTYSLISGAFSQNDDLFINGTTAHYHGTYIASNHIDGYLAEINFIDGQALNPSYFGEVSAETGAWVPKKYTGTYGTNGFYLPFNDGSSLANLTADRSGNGNNWTANNISLTAGATYDWMDDTSSNNFAVLNPLVQSADLTFRGGNLQADFGASTNIWPCFGSIGLSAGEWAWTATVTANSSGTTSALVAGMSNKPGGFINYPGYTADGWGYYGDTGAIYHNGSILGYGTTFGVGDVLGFKFEASAGTLKFYKQTAGTGEFVLQFTVSGLPSGTYFPSCGDGGGTRTGTIHYNFGQQPLSNTAWIGSAKALCTKNLPTGTITTSGTFSGNASTDGPFVYLNGVPTAMTINGNAVTLGNHADKLANGFKVRSSSASYNSAGSNTYSITSTGTKFKYSNAQGNP